MKRRTIKVGGGTLYADRMGSVILPSQSGKVVFERVYHVPDLGANLLSGRRLCMLGLVGKFDENTMFLQIDDTDMLRAHHRDGVYVLTWLSNDFPSGLLHATDNQQSNVEESARLTIEGPTDPEADIQQSQSAKDYFLMHRRFAHLGSKTITNLHEVTTHQPIYRPKHKGPCTTCAIGKMKKKITRVVAPRKDEILDLVSIDSCGPLPRSLVGNTTFLELVDNHSRKHWRICTKDRKSVTSDLDAWKVTVELQTGKQLKAIRLDNALELLAVVKLWVKKYGLTLQETEPYTSHQNGVAERSIQTTESSIRAMLHDSQLPIEFWDEAAMTDAYLRNLTPVGPIIDGKPTSPEQVYTGKLPSIDHIRVWGCKCVAYVNPDSHPPGTRRDKLMPKGREAVLMGFDPETTKQYRIYAPDLGRCIKSSTVTFFEDVKGGDIDLKLERFTPNELITRNPTKRPHISSQNIHVNHTVSQEKVPEIIGLADPIATTSPVPMTQPSPKSPIPEEPEPLPPDPPSQPIQPPRPPPYMPRAQTHTSIPTPSHFNSQAASIPWLPALKRKRDDEMGEDENVSKHIRALLAMKATEIEEEEDEQGPVLVRVPIPTTYEEAINDPVYGSRWLQAAKLEVSQLEANNTWIVEVPPEGANLVTSKWVFGVKYNPDGTIQKFKARLVARGFSQLEGIDYDETFAPTVRMDTMRVMLALMAILNWESGQIDVNNAFTESQLAHLIWMHAPPGVDVNPGEFLRLLQSLYGLKQAAYDWYFTCNEELVKLGFVSSESDPCLYIYLEKQLFVLIYVDDISIFSPTKGPIQWFKDQFAKKFKIKDLGELKRILGMEIVRDRSDRSVELSQTTYIKDVLKGLDMEEDRHRKTHIPLNGYDHINPADPGEERIDRTDYSRVIGKLMHMMVYTRPDIAFALGRLSQYMANPSARHGHGVRHLLRYLRSNSDMPIVYKANGDETVQIVGYSDADYAADKSRRSIMGQVFMLGGGPVSWASRKQRSVSTSTMEAEYMGLSECSRQAVWLTSLFTEIGYPEIIDPVHKQASVNALANSEAMMELKGDNNGAIGLVKNRQVGERSKHIDIAYHYVRELQKNGKINVNYIHTDDMVADGLTKPLAKQKFHRFLELLGMRTPNEGE